MNRYKNLTCLLAICISLYATGITAATTEDGPIIMRLAERGNEGAQVLLAGMYLRGEAGVERNDQKAAKQGHEEPVANLPTGTGWD